MVGRQLRSLKWKGTGYRGLRPSDRDRCFPKRLGSILHGNLHRGSMVKPGEEAPHQLFRTPCGCFCSESFCSKQNSDENPLTHGQCVSCPLHQQNGVGGGGTKSPVLAQLTSPEHFSITMIGSCLQLFSAL